MPAEMLTGLSELLLSVDALPSRYRSIANRHRTELQSLQKAGRRRYGPAVERIVRDILTYENLSPSRSGPLYAEGYVRPDFQLPGKIYLEITKWGDSNKLASILANGILVKAKIPGAKYFAIIASYRVAGAWTYDPDVDFYMREAAAILPENPIDGYYGFPTIDRLVSLLSKV